ncbi:hypothetical protein GCM10007160_01340 [Litchfieldella qijiaojingensis]|uniref:Uncharacterized protein n=1 Tax=Litchfieldella qijiaojingensis TaxID=980347 RepID=A0ABQ2YCH6_9GAMM|nr:hypothetical protein GCM10007160_01340 [Halomonas qijiaojingensis]
MAASVICNQRRRKRRLGAFGNRVTECRGFYVKLSTMLSEMLSTILELWSALAIAGTMGVPSGGRRGKMTINGEEVP